MSGTEWRQTQQELAPARRKAMPEGHYDLYPAFPLAPGMIELGYRALAHKLADAESVVIDGYGGVLWGHLREQLTAALDKLDLAAEWTSVDQALHPADRIEDTVAPFLGGDDPLFGTRFTGELADFFDPDQLAALAPSEPSRQRVADQVGDKQRLSILYGTGAALAGWQGLLVYLDVPKNEIQFRSRAGSITNLGMSSPDAAKAMYKRFYFVDWVALNRHKAELLPNIDVMVDGQRPDQPAMISGDELRAALDQVSRSYFRVRPWFEPGPWGGQWIKQKIPQLPQDTPNYAWSFELIAPENGLAFESDGRLLEVSFDCLLYQRSEAVLGECAAHFGSEFPIRFDFLDTFGGGNLSLQCHPRPEFIRRHFGESFTQDETYYILDSEPDARVYLGFQENIDPAAFRAELERSADAGTRVEVDRFVQSLPARRHDLFLIPSGTVHCSGTNTMVLEISATPYIFTFKLYDWLRLDLEGRPRPLNIDRAFDNLCFERKGDRVLSELVSEPRVLEQGSDWRLVHLPTHPEHFYDVHRFEFAHEVSARTAGSFHLMSLVEGRSVLLETESGHRQRFSYAETFVVPAAAGGYRLVNRAPGVAKVVKAFVKPLAELSVESVAPTSDGSAGDEDTGPGMKSR